MNTQTSENPQIPQNQEGLRQMIIDARRQLKLTEKDVNDRYHADHLAIGATCPTAIMTRVRDKRKTLSFSRRSARILAEILKLEPTLLYPPQSQQALLPIVEDDDKPGPVIMPVTDEESAIIADLGFNNLKTRPLHPVIGEAETTESRQEPPVTNAAGTIGKSEETRPTEGKKVNLGFYETPQGLMFLINMTITPEQMERLSLSIPEYMMNVEKVADGYFCRGRVPIFPYQAELLMRAIYGASR